MSFSNTFETAVLNWALTNGAVTRPTAWYVGLYTSDPTDAGTGTEVSGGGYAREAVTFTVTGNEATNSGVIEFDAATAPFGTVTHVAVLDALTGGNIITHGALSASKAIGTGDIFRIAAGDLDVTLD